MRKIVQDPHLLDEFLQEQTRYSPDFKAFVLKLLDQHGNIEQVAQQTAVPIRTLYNWLDEWNASKKKPSSINPASNQADNRP